MFGKALVEALRGESSSPEEPYVSVAAIYPIVLAKMAHTVASLQVGIIDVDAIVVVVVVVVVVFDAAAVVALLLLLLLLLDVFGVEFIVG